MTTPQKPPAPLEWHPAYRDRTWLLDWVEGRTGPPDAIRLPIPETAHVGFVPFDPAAPIEPHVFRTEMLTRRRAQALAPYVGRPFIYRWWCATDSLGRGIAGDLRIQYIDGHGYYIGWDQVKSRNGHEPVGP
jgi:hypothetical protein